MKNIYHDDSFNKDSQDLFSKTSFDLMKESNQSNPEKPKAVSDMEFFAEEAPPFQQKPAEPKRQAPPPIKRAAPPQPTQAPQTPPSAFYVPAGGAFVQPNAYPPSPVYPVPVQPYPVYMPPGAPYPAYMQSQPIPVYPPVQPAYPQPPLYPQAAMPQEPAQPPIAQAPSSPYPPTQPPYRQVAPAQKDPLNKEAGTRVLFQSPDFDNKEDISDDDYSEYSPSSASFDISEVQLPSRKRAGTPTANPSPVSFRIDDMEIGTYELNAMTLKRTTKTTGVDIPSATAQAFPVLTETEESYPEEYYPEENYSQDSYSEDGLPISEQENTHEMPSGIFPKELLDEEATEKTGKKKPSKKEIIRRIILAVSLIAVVVSCAMLYNEFRLHKENEKAMSSISDLIITELSTEPSTEVSATKDITENTSKTTTRPTTTKYLTPSEQFELLKKENPDITFPDNIQLKYAKLYAENQDFVGYLSAKGSELDFPVVQGEDDDEYLERNFFYEYTKYGCPFMTYRNNPQNLDRNTVIYGHNMQDGSLFGTLEQYLTLEGYKKAPVISFNTLYQDFNFKIIATMITNINPEDDNGYVFPYYWTNLNSTLNYTAYLNQLSQRSLYDTGVEVLPTDRLLTLSTCYDEFEDSRLVVVARLVRPGESVEVNTSKAIANPNPRFPQAYYDEYGETNPFANAYRWEIS